MEKIKDVIKENSQFTTEDGKTPRFIAHPDGVIQLSVPADKWHLLNQRPYKVAQTLIHLTNECIQRWLRAGKIVKTKAGCIFNNPLIIAPKYDKDGKVCGIRICLDARMLNSVLEQDDKFWVPRVDEGIRALKSKKFFGEFDLTEAYTQMQLAVDAQPYTAFTWQGQQYQFVGCPYGLKHIPALFQRFMVNLFHDMPFVYPYIDNLPFGSDTADEHAEHARMIIERLSSVGIHIKPSSINLCNSEMVILGHLIDEQGIHLDPSKVKAFEAWTQPTTGQDLGTALGLATFLRTHIRHFADISASLEPLKKEKIIKWTAQTTSDWNLLKHAITHAPYLKWPTPGAPLAIAVDTSRTGIGAVLYEIKKLADGSYDYTLTANNIIEIVSKKLNDTQRRYFTYKQELWGLVYALRKFHTYIWGHRDVTVFTDHRPLIHILNQRTLANALQSWLDVILNYDLKIKHRPGILHVIPDALSRMYAAAYADTTIKWGVVHNIKFLDNVSDIMTDAASSEDLCIKSLEQMKFPSEKKPKRYRELSNNTTSGGGDSSNFTRGVHEQQNADNGSSSSSSSSSYDASSEEDVLHSRSSVVVEDDQDTYEDASLKRMEHEDQQHVVVGEDPRDHMTTEEALRWMNENEDVVDIEEEKIVDRRGKEYQGRDKVKLLEFSAERVNKLIVDMMRRGKRVPREDEREYLIIAAHLLGHHGEKAVLRKIESENFWWPYMMRDIREVLDKCELCLKHNIYKRGWHPPGSIHASRPSDHVQVDIVHMPESAAGYKYLLVCIDVFTGFVLCRPLKVATAEAVANVLWEWFCIVGPPKLVTSDNGPEFKNEVIAALMKIIGIHHKFTVPYHPEGNSRVENANKSISTILVKMMMGDPRHWQLFCPLATLMYNTRINEVTKSSPFTLMYGRRANEMVNYTGVRVEPITEENWRRHQEEVVALVYPAIEDMQLKMNERTRKKFMEKRQNILTADLPNGMEVYIRDPKYTKDSPRPRQEQHNIGPWRIVRRHFNGPYLLQDATGELRTVPIDQLIFTRSNRRVAHIRRPDDDDEAESYEVERLVDHRYNEAGTIEYLVKWKGYPSSDNTWEPIHHINNTSLINAYNKRQRQTMLAQTATEAGAEARLPQREKRGAR